MTLKTLNENYIVVGEFYKNGETICRKELQIQKKNEKKTHDLLVIMMNPGSSRPVGLDHYSEIKTEQLNKLIPTFPDHTQKKVAEFMESKGFTYAIILNLIDKCNPKSTELKLEDNIFSNFNSKNDIQEFLKKYLNKNQSVLLAWGSKGIFKVQILNILDELKKFKNPCFGYLNTNKKDKIYYYHPLKRGGEWLNNVSEIL